MYYCNKSVTGLVALSDLVRDAFSDDLSGLKPMKEFALHIERDASRDESEVEINITTPSSRPAPPVLNG